MNTTDPAERAAEAYCRFIDGDDFGSDHGHDPSELSKLIRTEYEPIVALLRKIEMHCPCGARPESLNTHPHVIGCPVEESISILTPKAKG